MVDGKFSNIAFEIIPLNYVAKKRIYRNRCMICKLSLLNIMPCSSTEQLYSTKTILSRQNVSPNILFEKVLVKMMACNFFLLFLAPSKPFFFDFKSKIFFLLSMTLTSLNTSMIIWKPPSSILLFSLKLLPSEITHHTLPFLTSPHWHQHRNHDPNTSSANATAVAWDTIFHHQITMDPIISSLTINMLMPENGPSTLGKPAGNSAYLFHHPC